jgi:hypothetical protein
MKVLSEAEYLHTMRSPMRDVTANLDEGIDIWPYIRTVATTVNIPSIVLQNEWVEYVYRCGDDAFDHILISTDEKNVFLAVIVNRNEQMVYGHHLLDLNEKYGAKKEA